MASATYILTLHETYFRLGFFNLGVDVSTFVSQTHGASVELLCGEDMRMRAKVNRTANTNGTPRIMGGVKLRDWFQTCCTRMGELRVDVLAPDVLQLTRLDA